MGSAGFRKGDHPFDGPSSTSQVNSRVAVALRRVGATVSLRHDGETGLRSRLAHWESPQERVIKKQSSGVR